METVSASYAKQTFGAVLARAAHEPLGIERHGALVAAVVPPSWLARADALDDRRVAREEQRQVELKRLLAHQRIGIELLAQPGRRRALLAAARREVRRWEDKSLCSTDYIERWREWLSLPVADLVPLMCSDAKGWGAAMRQNSPFAVAAA